MKLRTRWGLAGLAAVLGAFVYFQAATRLEERALAAQEPVAAAEDIAARHVDREQLMRDVAALAAPQFEGRRTGTPGGGKARRWIVEQFTTIGLTPAGDQGYLQPFTFTRRSLRGLFLAERPFHTEYRDAANVLGRIEGSAPGLQPIVISAHYDHLGRVEGAVYHGADDNASGVAVLLAAARYFKSHTPRHPMTFAAFDAEELGLHGAEAYVTARDDARRAAVNVNLDMVSRSDRHEIFAAGTYHNGAFKPLLDEVQHRSSVRILFGHDRPMYRAGGVENWTYASDHGAFHAEGVPFVYFGVADHEDYHQPTDTAEKIDRRFFGAAADMIVEAIRTFDERLP